MAGQRSRRRTRGGAAVSGTVRSSTWVSRAFAVSGLGGFLALALGFAWFGDHVASLKTPVDIELADGIAALTGGSDARLRAGIALVEAGKAPRLLISGVNQVTTAEQLRLVAGGKPETYACCIDLGREAIDTVGNGTEVSKWVTKHNVKRLILITDNYHMPRSLYEVGRVTPGVTLIPYPVAAGIYADKTWWKNERASRGLALEYAKWIVARGRGFLADIIGAKAS